MYIYHIFFIHTQHRNISSLSKTWDVAFNNKETIHFPEVLLHERGGYMEGGHMEQRLNRAEAKLVQSSFSGEPCY